MKNKNILILLLSFISILFVSIGFVFAQGFDFVTSQEIQTGLSPIFSLAEDFNKDGDLDLAVANRSSGTISILLGDSLGSFSLLNNFNVGFDPVDIASGDFNEDGILDLASSNAASNNISILLGNGNGSFFDGGTFFISLFQPIPVSIASGDFNNDNHLDLIAGNFRDNSISILFGDGTSHFSQPSINITVGSPVVIQIPGGGEQIFIGISSVKTADFNEDGNLDIAVVHNKDRTIFILSGDGAGNLLISKTLPIGFDSRSLSVADLNKDDKDDLIAGSQSGISVYLGDGNNNFMSKPMFSLGSLQASMAVADFNADGNLDLSAPNFFGGGVDVIAGDGGGGFVGSVASFLTGSRPRGATSGDFNKDDLLDLVITNSGSGTDSISILINNTLPPIIRVNIDLKPNSFPNCINLKSKGTTPLAILGGDDFDVKEIDISSVKITGASVNIKGNGEFHSSFEDVNLDSYLDLILHFNTADLQLRGDETEIFLSGNLVDGKAIEGSDNICFVKTLSHFLLEFPSLFLNMFG